MEKATIYYDAPPRALAKWQYRNLRLHGNTIINRDKYRKLMRRKIDLVQDIKNYFLPREVEVIIRPPKASVDVNFKGYHEHVTIEVIFDE